MKLISMRKLLWSLESLEPRVTVDKGIAKRAKRAIDGMIALSR